MQQVGRLLWLALLDLMSVIYLHSWGQITLGKHISDICTMHWEIYYIQSNLATIRYTQHSV